MSDTITKEFDFDTGFGGRVPCVVTLYRKNGGYVVDSIDAFNDQGGELPEYIMKCIEEKAVGLCEDDDADVGDRLRDEAAERGVQ